MRGRRMQAALLADRLQRHRLLVRSQQVEQAEGALEHLDRDAALLGLPHGEFSPDQRSAARASSDAAAHRAFERRRVGPVDVVAGSEEARRDGHRRPLQAGRAGEGRALLDHRAHGLERAAQVAPERDRGLRQRRLLGRDRATLDPHGGAADDEGEQPGIAAEPAAVEHELRRPLVVGVQGEQRLGQRAAGAARVDGDDRLVAQRAAPRRPRRRRAARAEPRCLDGAGGDDDAIDRHAVDRPAGGATLEPLDAMREADRRARLLQPGERGRRKDLAEAARGSSRSAAPALDPSASCRTRRKTAPLASAVGVLSAATQSGSMKSARDGGRQATARVGDRRFGRAPEAAAAPGRRDAQQGDPVAPRPAAPAEDGEHEGGQRRAAAHPQAGAVGIDERQRPAQEGVLQVDADDAPAARSVST